MIFCEICTTLTYQRHHIAYTSSQAIWLSDGVDMHIILGLIALIGGAYFWANRIRNAADMTRDLGDLAGDALGAARRFGFSKRANVHPVESLDDSSVATAGTALAFLELGGLANKDQHESLIRSIRTHLGMNHSDAEEAIILARWLITESGGASSGLTRLGKRLHKLSGHDGFAPLMAILNDIGSENGSLSVQQKEALHEIAQVFRIQ